jgi:hypothetical protein
VAQLHPDRQSADSADTDRLQRLNRLYGAALAFEQRYGRLPAAAAGTRRLDSARVEETPSPVRASGHDRHVQRTRTLAAPRRNRARYYLALVILLALAFAIWGVGVVAR